MSIQLNTLTLIVALGVAGVADAAPISGQGTWETTLQGRDLDGNTSTFEAYYDTDLGITWLADANYAGTPMDWLTANAWATNLNPYGSGISGWRLPTTIDVGNDGCSYTNYYQGIDCGYNITTHSEMSHMFYATLGDKALYDSAGASPQPGWGLINTGVFSNIQRDHYWSATAYALSSTSRAWAFHAGGGLQEDLRKTGSLYAWAVHDGDIAAVPVPAAAWLFGSGLLGLASVARRRETA